MVRPTSFASVIYPCLVLPSASSDGEFFVLRACKSFSTRETPGVSGRGMQHLMNFKGTKDPGSSTSSNLAEELKHFFV